MRGPMSPPPRRIFIGNPDPSRRQQIEDALHDRTIRTERLQAEPMHGTGCSPLLVLVALPMAALSGAAYAWLAICWGFL